MGKVISTDPMTLYMKEVSRYKLLSAADEINLSQQIEEGNKQARHAMINANLRLVVKISRRYLHRGLPLEDMIEDMGQGDLMDLDDYKIGGY